MFTKKEILRFTIPLLHYCNLSCTYCHVPNQKHQYLDFELFKKGVDFFYEAKGYYKNLILYGGEPLLLKDKQLEDIINYCVEKKELYPEKKIDITLVTNFTTYRPSLELLIEKIDNLCISIDGKKQSHDVNRGMFDITFANFKKIQTNKKIMKGATINKVVNKNNVSTFYEDVKYLVETFGVPVSYNAALSVEDWDNTSLEVLKQELEKIYTYAESNNLFKTLENFFRLPIKSCPFGTLSMSLNGGVYNCEFIANDEVNSPSAVIDLSKAIFIKKDIRDCFYTISSKRCEREDCLSCGMTCTKFSFQKNTKLLSQDSEILSKVKKTRQQHLKHFRKIVTDTFKKELQIYVHIYEYDNVYAILNFLFSLHVLLEFQTFYVFTNYEDNKNEVIEKIFNMLLKKTNAKFNVHFKKANPNEHSLKLDMRTSFVTLNDVYIGNINSEMNNFLFP